MTRIPRIVHSRMIRRQRRRSNLLTRIAFAASLFISLSLLVTALSGVIVYARASQNLPSAERLTVLLDPEQGLLLQPTRIYARDGEQILWAFENPLIEEREYAVLDLSQGALRSDIPPQVVKTTLATTDAGYFSRGNSAWSLWREREAFPRFLASELLLSEKPQGSRREIHELILANQLVTRYGREQVLEWYLNSTYYGRQVYGVASAARVYFDKHVSELNLAEGAILAVVAQAPALNPFDAPEAARERQVELLAQMEEEGMITEAEYRAARNFEVFFRDPAFDTPPDRPPYVEFVLSQLSDEIPRHRLLRGGFKIRTSIDSALQAQIECTVESGLGRYRGDQTALEEGCDAARLLPTYPGLNLPGEIPLATDIVQLDPRNGQILAMYGANPGSLSEPFSPRVPGSLLTPYIYLTAFAQGYDPAALVWDIPLELEHIHVEDVHPSCVQNCTYRGPVSIRYAMANDYLVPAIEFWENFRAENIENTLAQMGVKVSEASCPECQLFQGSHRVSVLDIAHSFGVFSHGGVLRGWPTSNGEGYLDPVIVLGVEDYQGGQWRNNPRVLSRAVISKQLAYLITHVLSDSQARRLTLGQQNVFDIGRPVAVKRGFTYRDRGAWTVGYTPQMVTAVWVGYSGGVDLEAERVLPPISSGLWRALTQSALKEQPVLSWERPAGMTALEVCLPSGLLPTENCPETIQEIFVEGNEPTQRDNLYQNVEINRETGRLATVFTPPELIEEKTFLNIPAEARDWAREVGISTPPQEYDVAGEGAPREGVRISYPGNFDWLNGQVVITGTVSDEELVSYRVQVGKGLNPDSWQQIGDESRQPVQGGVLVIWDTTDMEDGLYAVQLVAVREGQRVEKVSALVSIDNTRPTVSINVDGRQFTYRAGDEILFHAQAVDNASVEQVKFYVDDQLVATRLSPPFVVPWEMEVGEHDLRVLVRDKAGNMASQIISFEVER